MTGVPVASAPGATFYPQGAVLVELTELSGRWMPAEGDPSAADAPAVVRDEWSQDPDRTTRNGGTPDPRVRAWLDAGWL